MTLLLQARIRGCDGQSRRSALRHTVRVCLRTSRLSVPVSLRVPMLSRRTFMNHVGLQGADTMRREREEVKHRSAERESSQTFQVSRFTFHGLPESHFEHSAGERIARRAEQSAGSKCEIPRSHQPVNHKPLNTPTSFRRGDFRFAWCYHSPCFCWIAMQD